MISENAIPTGESHVSSRLEQNRARAVQTLDGYLGRPEESVLREHQIDVMQSLRDFFANGQTAGYINLPTGSGKSVVIAEVAQALGLRALVLSPTLQILNQTGNATRTYAPDLHVTERHGASKDFSGTVVNSTYQSLESSIKNGEIDPSEFDLLICDEAHTALGRKRHQIFQKFPNALMIGLTATPFFTQLNEYRKRNLIGANERWASLFEKSIHDMSLEEGIERGILTNLDVNILRTGVNVGDVRISGGEYNERDLERYLNIESRNLIARALIAGPDVLPETVNLPAELRQEIERIHGEIRGKKTAIFGISIEHIEELARQLSYAGEKARVVHARISPADRKRIFEEYESGEFNIILGVDMIRLGWDSPSTQVGLYLAPTRSGTVATQELGRILRTHPGKEKAIAVQMADLFERRRQSPILIPNLFDPYFVLRGSGVNLDTERKKTEPRPYRPKITFSGIGIDATIERARSQELLRSRINHATLEELDQVISNLSVEIYNQNPQASPLEFYRNFSDEIPLRIKSEVLEKVIQAIGDIDSNKSRLGKRVLAGLYMKSVLAAAENYFTGDEDEESEIMQAAISHLFSNAERINLKSATPSMNRLIKRGIMEYIAEKENIPLTWVRDQQFQKIKEMALKATSNPTNKSIRGHAEKIALETGAKVSDVEYYIMRFLPPRKSDYIAEPLQSQVDLSDFTLEERIDMILDFLPKRERKVIELRFGLFGNQPMILEQVAQELGVTRERIRQIEAKALRKLRHPSRRIRLSEYIEEPLTHGITSYSEPRSTVQERSARFNSEMRERYSKLLGMGIIKTSDPRLRETSVRPPLSERAWSVKIPREGEEGTLIDTKIIGMKLVEGHVDEEYRLMASAIIDFLNSNPDSEKKIIFQETQRGDYGIVLNYLFDYRREFWSQLDNIAVITKFENSTPQSAPNILEIVLREFIEQTDPDFEELLVITSIDQARDLNSRYREQK